jgi:hypothetical protein
LSQQSAAALGGRRAQMRRQIVDRASERASGCCVDEVSLELAPEVAADALDQPGPVLAKGFRLRGSSAHLVATAEVADRGLRGRHRLTRGAELLDLSQELFDGVCDLAGGRIALADTGGELSLRFLKSLQTGERFALLDESLFELVDGALGDGDVSCGLGFLPVEVCYRILALPQPDVCPLELPLERGQRGVKLIRFR